MQVRRATMTDVIRMQHCNLMNLPENYNLRYYHYHFCSWAQLLYVVEDTNGDICGYVLAKMDEEDDAKKKHGHITSLATLRTHRKLGVASRVMRATMTDMDDQFEANFCSLHVRRTNEAALHLYQETLDYRTHEIDEGYYVDNEDAFHMKHYFRGTGQEKVAYVKTDGTLQWMKWGDTPGGQAMKAKLDQKSGQKNVKDKDNGASSGKNAPSGKDGGGGKKADQDAKLSAEAQAALIESEFSEKKGKDSGKGKEASGAKPAAKSGKKK